MLGLVEDEMKIKIVKSFERALPWILFNQHSDGGFDFQYSQKFIYGSKHMSNCLYTGAMSPTWFRLLSSKYIFEILEMPNNFVDNHTPCFH